MPDDAKWSQIGNTEQIGAPVPQNRDCDPSYGGADAPPPVPAGARWGRRAQHQHGEHCDCVQSDVFKFSVPRVSTSRRRRMRRGICVPLVQDKDDLSAMGGMTQDDDEVLENDGDEALQNLENVATPLGDLVQRLKGTVVSNDSEQVNPDSECGDPEVIDIDEGKYEYMDFEIIQDDTFFEVVEDDAYDTEFLSSIQFQSPSTEDGDGQDESPSDASTEEDGRMALESPAHQWEILKCALVPGYVHVDIREKRRQLEEVKRRSHEAYEAKELEYKLAEPGRRGRCLFSDEDMHDGWKELDGSREEESIEHNSVHEDPRPIDSTIAFLDSDDIEVNVNESDADKEFLDETMEVAIDSGAGDHVAGGEEAAVAYTIEESPGSLIGQHFTGAGGHRMKNMGQLRLHLRADNGKKGRDIKTTFQVAKVTRPLMSVSKICDAGLWVKFTKNLAVIMDENDKEVCRFIRRGGLYVARMKIRNPRFNPKPQDFPRQGTN